jgi:hemerythrin superfamily protein
MVEHASLRLRFRVMKEIQNYNSIYAIEEFVRSCHAKVEDDVVFPMLRLILESQGKQAVITNFLNRLGADHRLIDTIGEQIRLRTIEGKSDILEKRILLYCSTVETHNTSEETQIFSYWIPDAAQEQDAVKRALKIIREFGISRYYDIMGFSEELMKKFEKGN